MAGAHPSDRETFPESVLPRLQSATADLSWLLGREYAEDAATTLVGNHYQLNVRQRMAVRRSAASERVASSRKDRRRDELGVPLAIDGFNQLVTIERALDGGALLRGRDSALRDVASVHGTWRKGERTERAIALVAAALLPERPPEAHIVWVLDSPISNSGRLAELLRSISPLWSVEVVGAADARLAELGAAGMLVGTSDGALIDRSPLWAQVAERALGALPEGEIVPWIVDLSGG